MSLFVHSHGIKTVHAKEGGGRKMAKFGPRSCWMIPNTYWYTQNGLEQFGVLFHFSFR